MQNGRAGTDLAKNRVAAWVYDPRRPSGQRFTVWAGSSINRFYHSTALLLPDATIFVGGSEFGGSSCTCSACLRLGCKQRIARCIAHTKDCMTASST